jgi:hypothetical protein
MTERGGRFWSQAVIAVRAICFTPLLPDRRPIFLNEGHQRVRIDVKQLSKAIQGPVYGLFNFPTKQHVQTAFYHECSAPVGFMYPRY